MKAVILAGGRGTRISEETDARPKPMVAIGGKPIIWHIMKIYGHYGINEFIICLGYRGYMVKEYFANYFLHTADITFEIKSNRMEVHQDTAEPWRVTLVETGADTMTGGRLGRVRPYLNEGTFLMTYGDGVADIDIRDTIAFHRRHGRAATMTVVFPEGRFGAMDLGEGAEVLSFKEKPKGDGNWVNGGFFVLEASVLDLIDGDHTVWEREPMETLAARNDLHAYKHHGYWQPMDTLRDKLSLEELWQHGQAPWKVWE